MLMGSEYAEEKELKERRKRMPEGMTETKGDELAVLQQHQQQLRKEVENMGTAHVPVQMAHPMEEVAGMKNILLAADKLLSELATRLSFLVKNPESPDKSGNPPWESDPAQSGLSNVHSEMAYNLAHHRDRIQSLMESLDL